ncbi:NAD(P)-dependent oxidoreductase [Paenibacillus piscarius]|uniref:NAD(P)-dependent oxidoreductase n=1 Tax=Paenibacillus piscarius TaxID=1089681 RepID=UPI001EE9459F|nr:SDR family oxidoreductase [Paenibacillus piscarius]
MNILILGATGRVGSHLVTHALQDGHHVTVLVRTPEKVQPLHDNLTIIEGNVLSQDDVARAVQGNDVVISALNTDGTTTLSDSMPFIIGAMYKEGIERIITVGTAGILQSELAPELLRYQSSESKRRSTRAAEEHERAYSLLERSALKWTIVCPTALVSGERLGTYRVRQDILPAGGTEISVADTAEFTYSQIAAGDFINTRVGIAY